MISKKSKILATLSLSLIIGLGSHVLAAPQSTSEGVTNSTNMVRMFRGKGGLGNNGLNPLIEKLGLTMDEVASAKASGKTLFDLAEDKGYTPEEVRNILIEAKTEAINKALADGKITQEKADELIDKVKEDVANCDGNFQSSKPLQKGNFTGKMQRKNMKNFN